MESGRAVFPPGKQEKFEGLGYSPAVTCGPFLFVAGQVGVGDSGVVEDPEAQFRLAFEKLFALCREAAFFKVKKEFFPAPPYPAFTGLIEVNHYIVQGAVHEAQENYAEFHRKVFDEDGNFLHDVWQTYDTDKYAALCNMAVSKLYFSCGIVFLWTARMLAEVKQSLHLMHDLYCIPQLPLSATAKQMVYQVKDGDEIECFEILALNRLVRIMLTVLIALPKIGVAFILMLSGCRWLAATQSFGDLILNALALEFVIGIDELMFEAFTPEQTRNLPGRDKA
ncbi:yjgH [Symbiodinium microadriaticum]|nr:yjgH [Symbiodinium microadriaticum]